MFGFVTFVYPETVKRILAKGNPHFVCDSRVLVKPYKEKGNIPDKYLLVLILSSLILCAILTLHKSNVSFLVGNVESNSIIWIEQSSEHA